MSRSTSGSVRTNLSNGEFSWIFDADAQRFIVLHHPSKVAVVSPMKLEGLHPMWGYNEMPKPTNNVATYLGIVARQVLFFKDQAETTADGAVWIAEDLGVVMKDIKPLSDGNLVWNAMSIELSEPPESNFQVPEGYSVVAQPTPPLH